MSIAPIVKTVEVKASPMRAFEIFTLEMGKWWPHGRTPAKNAHAAIVMEQKKGGRWFERDAEGNETLWGTVLAWEPPGRLLLGWQLNRKEPGAPWGFDPDLLTEVELTFQALDSGGTRVRLEHRDLERYGRDAEANATNINGGWSMMTGIFADYANSHS